jgi:hypothetical protein
MKSPEMGIEPRRRKLRKTKSFKDYAEWRNIGHDMELGNRQYSEEWAHKALAYMERK